MHEGSWPTQLSRLVTANKHKGILALPHPNPHASLLPHGATHNCPTAVRRLQSLDSRIPPHSLCNREQAPQDVGLVRDKGCAFRAQDAVHLQQNAMKRARDFVCQNK